jgi:hypothetical protein
LSLDSAFADLSVSTALSPVSITFSRAIWVATSFESLVARGAEPKAEGALPFDDADPLDEEASVEEALVLAVPEGPPDCDAEAPADSLALAPTLVSVTLYVLTAVLSVGAIWGPPDVADPATAQTLETKKNATPKTDDRVLIVLLVWFAIRLLSASPIKPF